MGYAFAEGWAHYCEEMMYEKGLGKGDPEKHIGQTHRCAAARRALAVVDRTAHAWHDGGAIRENVQRAGVPRSGNARQQAARGTYDPAYLNYTLGKLMIRKLRTDWIAKHCERAVPRAPGDDQALWHDFHDKFLSYGGPPIPLLRKEMVGEEGSGPINEDLAVMATVIRQ